MSVRRAVTAAICAGLLALGVAACGVDGPEVTAPTATEQRAAVTQAIASARMAVDALSAGSPETALAAAERAVETAKTAVTGGGALTVEEKSAHETTIAVIEGNLSRIGSTIRERLAQEPVWLAIALSGPRIADIAATVRHGAAPAMAGRIPGTPATVVSGLETAPVAGSTVTAGAWAGGTYRASDEVASDEAAGTRDRVVLYTDIEAPGTQPFSGEGGKYGIANGLDGVGNLPIVTGTDATLIASSAFPTAPGIRTHEADDDGRVGAVGTFDGAEGRYVCMPAAGSPCRSSIRQGGGIALSGGGGWTFVPAADARVAKPDGEHRYFGWWLRDTGGAYSLGAFHGGVGDAADEFSDLSALQGTVTYRGPAAGQFVLTPPIGAASAGAFTASAVLEADFGDGTSPGTVSGTVDGFRVEGSRMPWSIELQAAAIGMDGAIAASGTDTALTVWTIDDRAGAVPSALSPAWEGRFHEVGEDRVPAVATGTFEAAWGELGRMIGAFGATRQQ